MKFLKSYQGIMKVVVGSSNKLIFRWEGKHVFDRSNFLNLKFSQFEVIMEKSNILCLVTFVFRSWYYSNECM